MTTIYKRFPTPIFSTQYSIFLDGMQYAKGWYVVPKIPVILYTDNNFDLKKVQFSSRNTINGVKKNKKIQTLASLALIFDIVSSFIRLNMNWGN